MAREHPRDRGQSLRDRGPAAALVATSAVSVQFGAALATHLFHRVGPDGAVTLRLSIAALALLAISGPGVRDALRGAGRRNLAVAAAFGVVLAGMNFAFYESIARVPLGVAVTVEFVGPLAVTIAASRRVADVLWAVMGGAGVLLLAGGGLFHSGRPLDLAGIALALIAGVCWAGYILLNAQVGERFAGTSGLAIAMVIASVVILPVGIAHSGGRLFEWGVLGIGALVAVLSSVLPYSLELRALRRVTPRVFGILLSVDPGVAALAGLLVLHQHLGLSEVAALILVVLANAGSSWFDSRDPKVVALHDV